MLLCMAAFNSFISKPVLTLGVALTQVKDLVLGLVEPHEIHTCPLLKLVQDPLGVIPSLRCVDCTTQLGVICKLDEGALNSAMSLMKILNSIGPSTVP